MKKILMLCFGVLSVGLMSLKAQGTLQFNQVLLLENSTTSCTACWTVPAGKVWKVEMASSNSENLVSLWLNNKEVGTWSSRFYTNTSSSWWGMRYDNMKMPFWLGAGHVLGFSNLGSSRNISFSVIEFNVVP